MAATPTGPITLSYNGIVLGEVAGIRTTMIPDEELGMYCHQHEMDVQLRWGQDEDGNNRE